MYRKRILSFLGLLVTGALTGTVLNETVSKAWADEKLPSPSSSAGVVLEVQQRMAALGQIIEKQELAQNNLTAWLIQAPNGKQMTFYTTADGKNIFSGAVWDLTTKQNINHVFASAQPQPIQGAQSEEVQVGQAEPLLGKYTGAIPEAIAALESLGGSKMGSGSAGETLYIIIDPRCPYCHQAYASLIPYMDKGVTIKWIPTVALGRSEQGLPLANAVLHAKTRAELDKIMADPPAYPRALSGNDQETLQRNLTFMFQAFEQNGGQAGVPVAFFIDQKSGQPRMMMGISEEVVIQTILGKL